MERIAQLAARQCGHVTRRQLLELGVSAADIRHRVADRTLVVAHRGVYALGYPRVEPVARAMAAVLACGDGAVLSHDSALALWGLWSWPRTPEVTARRCVRRPGIVAHRSITLTDADRTVQLGVPVTRAARAIADVHPRLPERRYTRLANTARLQRLITADEAWALLHHDRNPTRSGLEDAFQRWIQRHHLPQPLINAIVNGHEVDAVWLDARVIAELDDPVTHSDPVTFRSDRRHDREDAELGSRTLRFTREDLTAAEAKRVRRILDARRQS